MAERMKIGGGMALENSKGEILMGLRTTESGKGKWCIPGGFYEESDESIFAAMLRELEEESGINPGKVEVKRVISINETQINGSRRLNFGVLGRTDEEPGTVLPDEISKWEWWNRDEIFERIDEIFEPSRITLECYFSGKIQSDGRVAQW